MQKIWLNYKHKILQNNSKKTQKKRRSTKLSEKMNKISLRIQVKAGENGKIFGGVSAKDISEAFEKQHNIKIDKKKNRFKRNNKNIRNTYSFNKTI